MKEFKLIVAGSRGFSDADLLLSTLNEIANVTLANHEVSIVTGMARGADKLAYDFAKEYGVTCYEFPANWDRYGKRAGFLRNEEMAQFSDGLLAFWDGMSRGTAHMIQTMERMGKWVQVVRYDLIVKPVDVAPWEDLAGEIDTTSFPNQGV